MTNLLALAASSGSSYAPMVVLVGLAVVCGFLFVTSPESHSKAGWPIRGTQGRAGAGSSLSGSQKRSMRPSR